MSFHNYVFLILRNKMLYYFLKLRFNLFLMFSIWLDSIFCDMAKHELRVTSCELRVTSWKFKNTSRNSKVRVQIYELQDEIHQLRVQIQWVNINFERGDLNSPLKFPPPLDDFGEICFFLCF